MLDLFIAVDLVFLFLFFETFVLFSDIFDELNDGFVVEVVDTVLDLLVMDEGIVVLQKGLEKLRNTVLDGSFFENSAEDQFGNEFNVAHDLLFCFLQEEFLVFRGRELWELFNLLVKGVLNRLNEEELERVVFFFFGTLELEFFWKPLAEVRAQLSVRAGILWLLPSLLNDLFN